MKKIVITGGHHNSALVVAEALRDEGYQVIWFGHKYTMEGDFSPGAEYQEVTAAGFDFVEIRAAKFFRFYRPRQWWLFFKGFAQSFLYLCRYRPDLVFSFGGYLAFPVVVWAWVLRIPVFTHEQTAVCGWANRLISRFAKKIFVSWESSLSFFPAAKTVFSGLPLRPEIFSGDRTKFRFKNNLPVIYLTGGKQGAEALNVVVKNCLPQLLAKYNLLHQTGQHTLNNDFAELQTAREDLPPLLRERYVVRDYFFQEEIGAVFATADLVVGRSGAHFVYEVACLGKPALFIPLPWAHGDEQTRNAWALVETGLAEIIPQENLSPAVFTKKLAAMTAKLSSYSCCAAKAKALAKQGATEKIVASVRELWAKD